MKYLILITSILISTNSYSKETYQGCVNIQYNILLYDQLRRKGGSLSQMNKWQLARNEMSSKYYEKKCRKRFGLKPTKEAKKMLREKNR